MERVLVIDDGLSPGIAGELRTRGRSARSLRELGWESLEDPGLLRAVFGRLPDPILITGDDDLPAEQPQLLAELRATVATIEPWEPHAADDVDPDHAIPAEEAYERELIHRWVQAMQAQRRGTVRRYFPTGPRAWRPRR
jgi:hypothetical protein